MTLGLAVPATAADATTPPTTEPAAEAKTNPPATLAVPQSFGVNIHFTDAAPGEMKNLADAGFKWVRMDLSWAVTEKSKGEYDFSSYQRLLKSCDEVGVRALLIFDYSNKLYDDGLSPHTDEGRAAFAKWAAAAATHFKGRGVLWEMYNEPNIGFWKPQPNVDDYIKLALAVGKALHGAAPDEAYIGPATSQVDTSFLEHCFRGGLLEHWSAVSVHPYRQGNPESAGEDYRRLRQLIERYAPKGKTIPILSGEWGYSTAWKHFDVSRQAKYLTRELLTNLYNEVPVSIWYDWKDDGTSKEDPEHHFGTLGPAPDLTPKPAFAAMKTLTASLGGFNYNKRLAIGDVDRDYVLVFDKGSEVRLAVWTTAKEARALTIPATAGAFRVVDLLGKDQPALTADDKGLVINATDSVQYVIPEKLNETLRLAAALQRAPLDIVSDGGRQLWTHLDMRNPLTEPIGAIGATTGPFEPHVFPIDPGNTETIPARGYILRDVDPQPLPIQVKVRETCILSQWTHLIATNPLRVTVMPLVDNLLTLEIDNPAGEAFEGMLMLTDTEGKAVPPKRLAINAGDKWATVQVPFPGGSDSAYRFGVRVEDADHNLILKTTAAGYRPVDHFARFPAGSTPQGYGIVAEGTSGQAAEHSLTSEVPQDGMPLPKLGALKVTYRLPHVEFIRLSPQSDPQKKIDGKPAALAMWIYGDGQHARLRARFVDSTGQYFQPVAKGELTDASRVGWKGWQRVTFSLTGEETQHGNGADDGEVHYPIALDTLLLIEASGQGKTEGVLYVAEPVLMYP